VSVWRRILQSSDWRYLAAIIPVMVLLQAIGPEYFRYRQDAVADGQLWRLLSAHWVHVGWMHLLLNGLSLVICVALTAPGWSARRWLLVTLTMGLGISLLLMLNNPEVVDYAGHSGILYGLYVLGGIGLYRRDRLVAVLVIAAIVIKVLMEQFSFHDFNTGALIGARVIVDAHLYGLLMAVVIALLWATYTMNPGPGGLSD
jgi:rhomboid family GlyGly-CTERM serine protease